MNDTVFGKIIGGEIPCTKIYEDDQFLAFLDINPVQKGHTLLLPKEPYTWMEHVPNELLAQSFILAKKIMVALKQSLGCDYVHVVVEGIQVPHFHIHLIPSMLIQENADWHHTSYAEGEKESFAEKIKSSL